MAPKRAQRGTLSKNYPQGEPFFKTGGDAHQKERKEKLVNPPKL
jgi:hypothetical protein